MKAGSFSLRELILVVSVLFFLPGAPLAFSALKQDFQDTSSWNLLFGMSDIQRLGASTGMPGEAPAFADFDGDHKEDVAAARLSDNQYKIVLFLSTRFEMTVLKPPAPLAGFTVHACDFNSDSFQDIVVADAIAKHPLVVWYGDGRGNFEISDQNLFANDSIFAEPSKCDGHRLSPDQDLLDESPDQACGRVARVHANLGLQRTGFFTRTANSCALPNVHASVTPRGPPPHDPAQDRSLLS
jgi:hypothetical protein